MWSGLDHKSQRFEEVLPQQQASKTVLVTWVYLTWLVGYKSSPMIPYKSEEAFIFALNGVCNEQRRNDLL